jgi:hypothetical protein
MQIRGRSREKPADASGMVRFAHRGQNVAERLVGEITCLSKDDAGLVSVTGTIVRSEKRNNDNADRKAPGVTAPTDDDGTALIDTLAHWDADEAAQAAEPVRHSRGGELAGKDFAFTIDVPGKPQKFSKPAIGERGTLVACSSGADPVEVTRGGFRAREAGDKAGSGRDGRRWWRR